MTDQDGVMPADLPSAALPEPRCEATTQSGSRCRNRPLESQRYCRMHIALAGETNALPSAAVTLPGSTAAQESISQAEDVPIEIAGEARADAVAAVEELEVEIRNQADTPAATRDLIANILRLIRENLVRMAPDQLGRVATRPSWSGAMRARFSRINRRRSATRLRVPVGVSA